MLRPPLDGCLASGLRWRVRSEEAIDAVPDSQLLLLDGDGYNPRGGLRLGRARLHTRLRRAAADQLRALRGVHVRHLHRDVVGDAARRSLRSKHPWGHRLDRGHVPSRYGDIRSCRGRPRARRVPATAQAQRSPTYLTHLRHRRLVRVVRHPGRRGCHPDDDRPRPVREALTVGSRYPRCGPGPRSGRPDGCQPRPRHPGDLPRGRHNGWCSRGLLHPAHRHHPLRRRLHPGRQGIHRCSPRWHRQLAWRPARWLRPRLGRELRICAHRHPVEGRGRVPAARRHPDVQANGPARRVAGEVTRMNVFSGAVARVSGMVARAKVLPKPAKIALWALFVIFLFLLPILNIPVISTPDSDFGGVLFTVTTYVLVALGLNIVVGYAGLLDLGYVGFYAVGAYTVGVLGSAHAQVPRPPSVSVFSLPHLDWSSGTPIVDLSNTTTFLKFGITDQIPYYWLALMVIFVVIFFDKRIKDSRVGRSWEATREDEDAAELMGVPTFKFKLLAFAMGAFIGGLSGALFAGKQGFISPDSFPLLLSILFIAAVVVGGQGNRKGVILGAIVVAYFPERFREFQEWRVLVFGLALMMLAIFRPQGLIPPRRTVLAKQADETLEALEEGTSSDA